MKLARDICATSTQSSAHLIMDTGAAPQNAIDQAEPTQSKDYIARSCF